MSTPEQLQAEFAAAWAAGQRPRVDAFLDRAGPEQEARLGELIDEFLATAPTPDYDNDALAEIRADPALIAAAETVRAGAGLWPTLLPRLRRERRLELTKVARTLADALGLRGGEERMTGWLARMERGELDAARVSRRLLHALGDALGVSADTLERAGGPGPALGGALFRADDAVAGSPAQESFAAELDALSRAASAPAPTSPVDELDRLFTGGRDA